MTSLPDDLRAAIEDVVTQAASRTVARTTARLSEAYRARWPSRAAVGGAEEVSAYLLTRLPATYAAIARVLTDAGEIADFAPRSLLDAGAGPGTASWAAVAQFPGLAEIVWLDHNRHLLEMAAQLGSRATHPALAGARAVAGSLAAPPLGDSRFDLVTAAYALTELGDSEIVQAALALWARCDGLLVIVEPGRPRDYARLMTVRTALLGAGAGMVAPCPHEHACPLRAGDWCHFAVRLPRSRAHRQAKGASLGYEDEKFSYLVVARPGVTLRLPVARVIKPPILRKFEVELPLCADGGLADRHVPSRDNAAFKAAKKLRWGDAVE